MMRGKFFKFIHYLVLIFLVLANFVNVIRIPHAKAVPTTWYASSSAPDGGNGSLASPFNTFHAAYQAASSGDTIDLTGTFNWANTGESGDGAPNGYTIAKSLTIQGQSATETFIQAANSAYTAGQRIFTINASINVTIQRLTLRYGYRDQDNWSGTAVYSSANLNLLSVIVTENANPARYGGAAISFTSSGRFVMRNSTIHNNGKTDGTWPGYTAALDGGGSDAGNEITNCTFTNNRAGYNGGIYFSTGNLTITNSSFINNYAQTTSADLGIWGGRVYLKNNIFGDSAGDVNVTVGGSGAITDNGYNIVETQDAAGFVNGVNNDLVGNQANLNVSHTLENNNSLYNTPTLALSAGSVAINAGNSSANNGITPPTEDQRGASRPDAVDIGAFEYGGLIDIPEPTTQSSDIIVSNITYNKATASWTNGDGSQRAVFAKATTSDFGLPDDNTAYTANSVFTSGSQIGSTGWYCVYNGTGTSVDITGLSPDEDYVVQVFEYNGTIPGTQNYYTPSATNNPVTFTSSIVATPSSAASNVTFATTSSTYLSLSWTEGNGYARAVFVKAASSGTAAPVDSTTYTANAVFSSGSQIGSSGWYCVYNGTGTSVTITGLATETTYRVHAIEYNGDAGSEKYQTAAGTHNPRSQKTLARPDGENFESGNLTTFSWVMGGTATSKNWTIASSEKNGGAYSAKAGAYQESSKTSSMEVTLNVLENGNISFYKKVSSEANCDFLRFYIDGVQQTGASWSGTVAWAQHTYAVTSGSRTFKWTYSKDGSVNTGSDTAWIDDIVFPKINQTQYSLEYSSAAHGSLTGDEYQAVISGGNGSAVTAVPDTGYHFTAWSDLLADNPRTDLNISSNLDVSANFVINSYALSYSAGQSAPYHGAVSGTSSQSVTYGGSGTSVTAVPNTGYHFVRWSDNSTANPRTDSNVSSALTVYAVFEINTYTVSYLSGSGGSISGSTSQSVNYGASGSAVLAVPNSGYQFLRWSDGITANPRIDINVINDFSVSAIFEATTNSNTASSSSGQKKSNSAISQGSTTITDYIPSAEAKEVNVESATSFFTKAYEKEGKIYLSEMRFRLIDQNGNPLANILVTLHSEPKQTTTNEDGLAIFKDVEPGDHKIEVAYEGKTITKDVSIVEPATKNQEVEMKVVDVKIDNNKIAWWWFALLGLILLTIIYFSFTSRMRKAKYRI